VFIRGLGGTIGISIGQAIYSSFLRTKLEGIQGELPFSTAPASLSESVLELKDIANTTLRAEVIYDYSRAISNIWLVMTPILGAGLFLSLFIRKYSMVRTLKREGEPGQPKAVVDDEAAHDGAVGQEGEPVSVAVTRTATASDIEKGAVDPEYVEDEEEGDEDVKTPLPPPVNEAGERTA